MAHLRFSLVCGARIKFIAFEQPCGVGAEYIIFIGFACLVEELELGLARVLHRLGIVGAEKYPAATMF
jgi:hypothetical protein